MASLFAIIFFAIKFVNEVRHVLSRFFPVESQQISDCEKIILAFFAHQYFVQSSKSEKYVSYRSQGLHNNILICLTKGAKSGVNSSLMYSHAHTACLLPAQHMKYLL